VDPDILSSSPANSGRSSFRHGPKLTARRFTFGEVDGFLFLLVTFGQNDELRN